jgi:hypothetical protein
MPQKIKEFMPWEMTLWKRIKCYFKGHHFAHVYKWSTHPYVAVACTKCGKEVQKIRVLND